VLSALSGRCYPCVCVCVCVRCRYDPWCEHMVHEGNYTELQASVPRHHTLPSNPPLPSPLTCPYHPL